MMASSLSHRAVAQGNEVWMLGPMLHINFGGEKTRASWGLELAYWNYNGFPYSFDGCLEFEKQKIRLYSEVQTGIGLAGLSMGPVVEFRSQEKNVKLGFQGSIWANYFLGFDFRIRRIGNETFICPGTYFKLPVGGIADDPDGDSDWDWDGWDVQRLAPIGGQQP